ncbi:putative membrane protein [Burkholderia thailandensis USAMRU Malaysia |nr:putative membrane protein [Burkholderia thailandensis E444]AIC88668.1 putative membrane protein [Burkholderia thailandensis USAMRU Malaysia \
MKIKPMKNSFVAYVVLILTILSLVALYAAIFGLDAVLRPFGIMG